MSLSLIRIMRIVTAILILLRALIRLLASLGWQWFPLWREEVLV
jgi:hypothetical protein